VNYTRHFIIEGKYLGASPCREVALHGTMAPPDSFAYLCPACGEVWAKAPVTATGEATTRFVPLSRACRKHFGHSLAAPGSVSVVWEHGFDESFTDEVVRWEFQRQMDYYNKE
jgi:hypothetical protein